MGGQLRKLEFEMKGKHEFAFLFQVFQIIFQRRIMISTIWWCSGRRRRFQTTNTWSCLSSSGDTICTSAVLF